MTRLAGLLLVLLVLAPSCAPKAPARGLLVFAAASLSDLMPGLGQEFGRARQVKVEFHFAGSSSLVTQVRKGSPADVLVLAGGEPLGHLEGQLETVVDVAGNRLVLAAAEEFARAHKDGWPRALCGAAVQRVALADPATAPAGRYGQQSLQGLGLWDCLQPKLVPSLDVRAALTLARNGSAQVAVVYATDAGSFPGVQVLGVLPDDSHDPILYPAALLKASRNLEDGRAFLQFLTSEPARKAFQKAGFTTPAQSRRASGVGSRAENVHAQPPTPDG